MTDGRAYADNAEGLLAVGNSDNAIRVALKGLGLSPDDPQLLSVLVRGYLAAGESGKAVASAENLLRVDPTDAMAHTLYAMAVVERWPMDFRKIRNWALPASKEAVRIAPAWAQAHYVYALCLARSRPVIAYLLVIRFYSRRAIEEARKSALRALELAPDWVPPLLLLGSIERTLGKRKRAAYYAEQALRLDPTDSETLLSAVHTSRMARRRTLARRLAVLHPSHTASDLVVHTHRPIPLSVLAVGISGAILSVFTVGDLIILGELAPGPDYLWALGPIVGIWVGGLGLGWRRKLLREFPPEVIAVVVSSEHGTRWIRRIAFGWILILPAMWWPASLVGGYPSAWAIAWAFTGVFTAILVRPRFDQT